MKTGTAGVEEPDTMSDANYYAHRIERALDDFPNDEHVPLHRDFLADAAKWLRYASGVITDAGRAALSSADAAGVEGKKR